MCLSWGATARAHVQGNDVQDLENGWTDRAQTWYIDRDRLVGWHGKDRPVVPLVGLWCPWRACGAPDKPVVP